MNDTSAQPASAPDAASENLPELAICARGLDKIYSGDNGAAVHALKAIDLDVPRGGIFGLLGPNGAGKSTFINILAGLVIKTGGTAKVWDIDIDRHARAARAAIGVVPQELNLDAFFTPRELLELQAGLYGVPPRERRTTEILERVGLTDRAEAFSRNLSGGMRRRLLVAKALVHNPPVLVLDEPTAGVDIELRQSLWAFVRELNANGTTVVLTTHYLEEAEELCDRIAIINHGQVIACEDTRALVGRLDNKELRLTVAEDIAALPGALSDFHVDLPGDNRLVFRYRTSETEVGAILGAVAAAGLTVTDLTTEEPDLEDVFLELTRAQP
ncbi:MAG: ATP-binding cassette domain-containing protein [Alphaproteobacteria bacterium]|nr:ATP-binding cassette domain-containing protein [Alphaproteobacteria bacterium]